MAKITASKQSNSYHKKKLWLKFVTVDNIQ